VPASVVGRACKGPQGKHAPGGARDYRVNDNLIGGFAMIAWPASYLISGVKTFMCNMDGIVYERDFGPDRQGGSQYHCL
jgi:hypothetical protein